MNGTSHPRQPDRDRLRRFWIYPLTLLLIAAPAAPFRYSFAVDELTESPSYFSDSESEKEALFVVETLFASLEQPQPLAPTVPAPETDPVASPEAEVSLPSRFRRSSRRLARAPDIFGDVFSTSVLQVDTLQNTNQPGAVLVDLPFSGGSRRVKIAEHNKATIDDRIIFLYNHFHNALDFQRSDNFGGPIVEARSLSVDRYTVGFEKSFDDVASIEVRLPFNNRFDETSSVFGFEDFSLHSGSVGNLAAILKVLLFENDGLAISAGLGLDLPTGSDVHGAFPLALAPMDLRIHNDSVHLLPFLGLMGVPNDLIFWHFFAQIDVPANGNSVEVIDAFGPREVGVWTEQTLLYLDLSGGIWVYSNPNARWLPGIALVTEIHFNSMLNDTDIVTVGNRSAIFNPRNRIDVTNATIGIHADLTENTQVRVGAVFPFGDRALSFFDSEAQAAVIRRF